MSSTSFEDLLIGQPIRDRYGINCCPAIREEDGSQYYVKTIRIPASAVQASGLLLSGAYENAEQIQEYYCTVAQDLSDEVALLNELSLGGGFLPFEHWSLEPAESGIGYVLTLRSKRYEGIADRVWTYRDAVNLGLDLCTALTAARQKGLLYANLKPENVFTDETGSFCIGDLGFIPAASLQYTSLPEKYRSQFTAPEVADIYATVSANMDVYALGLLLYRCYNRNQLPADSQTPPEFCDYELWKIISTACHTDPLQRYEDPSQLGKALLEYQQQFGVSDAVIGSAEPEQTAPAQDDTLFLSEQENETMLAELLASIPDEQAPADLMDTWMDAAQDDSDMTDMLAQADDLINHQLPQPVVAPSVIDVQLPQSAPTDEPEEEPVIEIVEETEAVLEEPIPEETLPDLEPEVEIVSLPQEEPEPDEPDEEIWDAPKKSNAKKIIITLSAILVALAIIIGGAVLYINLVYTKHIDNITLFVKVDSVTVQIDSEIDDSLLTVVCKPNFGETIRSAVKDGQAIISGLSPNTNYAIYIEISGFHQLTGMTQEIFSTPDNITVSNLSAVTDIWQGSVKLNFLASGNDKWAVRYFADGEEEKTVSFEGAEISITGLTPMKEYTFILETQDGTPILGSYQVKHTVR